MSTRYTHSEVNASSTTAADLATRIIDGSCLALAPDYSGCAIAVVKALIAREARQLQLVGVPQIGLQGDLLIGAGAVASIDAAAVTLGEFGQAPRFVEAVKQGSLEMRDSTCPVIHAGLQAAEKNIPFMPLRGILGSDLVRHRSDWKTIDNPFHRIEGHGPETATGQTAATETDPILLVPQIKPDIALFHAPVADRDGNVWIGIRRELMLMAHAATCTLVTVERISETSLMEDPAMAAGTIPSLYIDKIACVPEGAAPVGLFGEYPENAEELSRYASLARTREGFDGFLSELLNRP